MVRVVGRSALVVRFLVLRFFCCGLLQVEGSCVDSQPVSAIKPNSTLM